MLQLWYEIATWTSTCGLYNYIVHKILLLLFAEQVFKLIELIFAVKLTSFIKNGYRVGLANSTNMHPPRHVLKAPTDINRGILNVFIHNTCFISNEH